VLKTVVLLTTSFFLYHIDLTANERGNEMEDEKKEQENGDITQEMFGLIDQIHELCTAQADEIAQLKEQLEEALGKSASVAHDFNNVLSGMMANIQLAQKGLDVEDSLGKALKATKRMAAMVQALMTFAKTGLEPLKLETVDVRNLLEEILEGLKVQIEESGTEIIIGTLPATVVADRLQLGRILQNLIANAIKFRKPECTIQISVSAIQDDEQWVFFVKDNGKGIPVDELKNIFRPLHRVYKNVSGLGMGLAICKLFVELHDGRIWVESDGVGQGSIFMFTISVPKKEE